MGNAEQTIVVQTPEGLRGIVIDDAMFLGREAHKLFLLLGHRQATDAAPNKVIACIGSNANYLESWQDEGDVELHMRPRDGIRGLDPQYALEIGVITDAQYDQVMIAANLAVADALQRAAVVALDNLLDKVGAQTVQEAASE